jgi:transposase-like protein
MSSTVEQSAVPVPAVLPSDVVCTPAGHPAVLLVRTGRGWTVLAADDHGGWVEAQGTATDEGGPLTMVEAMSLADLVAAELGVTPEPGRQARRAARNGAGSGPADAAPDVDPRDEELAALRRTIGQLEHALAARVSIERAIGVLAERHCTTPREAFEELRRRARSQGRPAQELATEVLDGLTTLPRLRAAAPQAAPAPALPPALDPRPAGAAPTVRRVQRPRRAGGDPVPGTRS